MGEIYALEVEVRVGGVYARAGGTRSSENDETATLNLKIQSEKKNVLISSLTKLKTMCFSSKTENLIKQMQILLKTLFKDSVGCKGTWKDS